jgi:hypothetical protein
VLQGAVKEKQSQNRRTRITSETALKKQVKPEILGKGPNQKLFLLNLQLSAPLEV